MIGEANSTRLYDDYPRQRGDHEHFEYWEQKVDTYYLSPLESDEDVDFYSYLAFGLEFFICITFSINFKSKIVFTINDL